MSKLEIGVLLHLSGQPEKDIAKVTNLGLRSCQVCTWQPELWTDDMARRLIDASRQAGVKMTTVWAGYPGPKVWNFIGGPKTIGLVPRQYRRQRLDVLMQAATWAKKLPVNAVIAGRPAPRARNAGATTSGAIQPPS